MVFPDDARIGFTPARQANAASKRIRPGWDQVASTTAAVTAPIPVLPSSPGLAHSSVVRTEFLVERDNALGQAHDLRAGGRQAKAATAWLRAWVSTPMTNG